MDHFYQTCSTDSTHFESVFTAKGISSARFGMVHIPILQWDIDTKKLLCHCIDHKKHNNTAKANTAMNMPNIEHVIKMNSDSEDRKAFQTDPWGF